ncbi:MAG: hypothetical protein HZA78_07300 [Candidatus Schekmanbacteria bacterium]|nr:hypothetical protein [Candidatus Schekmanbacteria bacterium]
MANEIHDINGSKGCKIIVKAPEVRKGDVIPVTMRRTATVPTEDLPLWVVIRESTKALSFESYSDYIKEILCDGNAAAVGRGAFDDLRTKRFVSYTDSDAYRLLKMASEAFVMVNCGVAGKALEKFEFKDVNLEDVGVRVGVDTTGFALLWSSYLKTVNGGEDKTLPYLDLIRRKLGEASLKDDIFYEEPRQEGQPKGCYGILREKLTNPCLMELIWSYWMEEGMLVQTMNAIMLRFQNIRNSDRDPLAMMEIDPLRPLNNLLWGYIQDEQHRLSLVRRAFEYDHHYGFRLVGKALPAMRTADSRMKFLEAFHNLLHQCTIFFAKDDNTTIIADGFPIMNALKDVHLLLTEGAHNQYGDLPSIARIEMLMMQWLLARPEFREFLPTRVMVAYPEPWMDRVDAMKTVQGWTSTSVLHFRELAVFGEQVLLSVRFGNWSKATDAFQAANWARFWRSEIQAYIHAYRAVTGVDLTSTVTNQQEAAIRFTQPSQLLQQRLVAQQRQR